MKWNVSFFVFCFLSKWKYATSAFFPTLHAFNLFEDVLAQLMHRLPTKFNHDSNYFESKVVLSSKGFRCDAQKWIVEFIKLFEILWQFILWVIFWMIHSNWIILALSNGILMISWITIWKFNDNQFSIFNRILTISSLTKQNNTK